MTVVSHVAWPRRRSRARLHGIRAQWRHRLAGGRRRAGREVTNETGIFLMFF